MVRTVTRRGLAATVLVCAAALTLTGCGGDDSDAAAPTADSGAPLFSALPAEIQDSGTITVASSVGYPPFEVYDTDGTTITGIDPDIAAALGEQLGVTLEFEDTAFDGIIPGLSAGRYEMAMSGMSDTEERQQSVNFIDYFAAGPGILTTTEGASTYTTLDSLCGVTVAVTSGTTNADDALAQSATCEAEGGEPVEVTTFGADSESIQALTTGRVEVFLVDQASGATVAAEADGRFVMGDRYRETPFGIVFPKESTELLEAVQQAMEAIVADGTYAEILESYGQSQGALDTITVNDGAGA